MRLYHILSPTGRVSPSPSQESMCSSKSDTDPGVSRQTRPLRHSISTGLENLRRSLELILTHNSLQVSFWHFNLIRSALLVFRKSIIKV